MSSKSERFYMNTFVKMTSYAKRDFDRENHLEEEVSQQHETQSSKNLMSGFLNKEMSRGISKTNIALLKWREVAGKRGADHTKAVWLNEKNNPEAPELIVYLDNNSLIYDFTTNAELYIDRLSYLGFPVSNIKFALSNKVDTTKQKEEEVTPAEELPQLSSVEVQEIEEKCKNLPTSFKTNAIKAMKFSLQRQKLENTRKNKPTS